MWGRGRTLDKWLMVTYPRIFWRCILYLDFDVCVCMICLIMCFDASLKHFLNAYLLKRTDCERHKKDLAKDMSWTHKARRDGRGCLWSSAAVRGQARTSGSAGSDTASGPWSACFLWLWTQMYQNNWSKKQASTHKNITRAKVTLLIHSGASNDHTAWLQWKEIHRFILQLQ